MKPALRTAALGAAALLLGIAALVYMRAPRAGLPPDAPPIAVPEPPAAAPVPAPAPAPALPVTPEARRAAAERTLVAARARRAEALAELAAAEAESERTEREVAELERFIADLEARGEDPAEHAEQGLALFHPAFERYQAIALRLELAQAGLRDADAQLATAEQALAEPGAGSPDPAAEPARD